MNDEKTQVEETPKDTVPEDLDQFIATLAEDAEPEDAEPEADAPESEAEEAEEARAPEPVKPAVDPSVEAEARRYGWRPKEEWRGDKSGWVEPKRFLELPSTHVKQLRDRMATQEAEFNKRIERLDKGNRAALEAQKRQHEAQIGQMKAARRKAAEDGDMDTFDQLDKEVSEAEKQTFEEPEPPAKPEGPHPDVKAYMDTDEGAWIRNRALVAKGQKLIAEDDVAGYMAPLDQVKWAERQLKTLYPQMFPKSEAKVEEKQERKPRVDSGGLAGGKQQAMFSKLPPEAKRAAKEFKEMGYITSLEDYAKTYFEGEQA